MGDRCHVSLTIAGKLKRECIPTVLAALENYNFRVAKSYDVPADDGSDLGEQLAAEEVNYGTIDEVEDCLVELGLDYEIYNDAGGSYPAGTKRKIGDRCEEATGEEPSVPYSRILEVETLITAMGDLIREAKFWAAPIGELVIVP